MSMFGGKSGAEHGDNSEDSLLGIYHQSRQTAFGRPYITLICPCWFRGKWKPPSYEVRSPIP